METVCLMYLRMRYGPGFLSTASPKKQGLNAFTYCGAGFQPARTPKLFKHVVPPRRDSQRVPTDHSALTPHLPGSRCSDRDLSRPPPVSLSICHAVRVVVSFKGGLSSRISDCEAQVADELGMTRCRFRKHSSHRLDRIVKAGASQCG